MSVEAITKALEKKLATMTPAIATAWENEAFTPIAGTPYQSVFILFGRPQNPTMGDNFHRKNGFMQISLKYPANIGKSQVLARANAIEQFFHRGLSLVESGVTTVIDGTPEVGQGHNEGDRFVVNVFVRFFANIGV